MHFPPWHFSRLSSQRTGFQLIWATHRARPEKGLCRNKTNHQKRRERSSRNGRALTEAIIFSIHCTDTWSDCHRRSEAKIGHFFPSDHFWTTCKVQAFLQPKIRLHHNWKQTDPDSTTVLKLPQITFEAQTFYRLATGTTDTASSGYKKRCVCVRCREVGINKRKKLLPALSGGKKVRRILLK